MTANEYFPKPPVELINCIIEAYTVGEERRAHAHARLKEIRPGIFALTPFYLRHVSGLNVVWQSPKPGTAIETASPITNVDEAHDALVLWATQTAANRRQ